jgi:hypothetical protein
MQSSDHHPTFRRILQYEPDLNRVSDPQRYAQWQVLRRHLAQEGGQAIISVRYALGGSTKV